MDSAEEELVARLDRDRGVDRAREGAKEGGAHRSHAQLAEPRLPKALNGEPPLKSESMTKQEASNSRSGEQALPESSHTSVGGPV